tara:strand:- start:58 stop:264 length:207 start_codon:yes stop_codon:yes gene_type:complete
MLSLVEVLFRFFNVRMIQNKLNIVSFDVLNNVVTIQQNESSESGRSVFDPKIVAAESPDTQVFSRIKN